MGATGQTEPLSADPRFPFLAHRRKTMLIGGRWVPSASEATFETINPANGQVLAEIADGSEVDVDRAVSAAREAFEGDWRLCKPFDRQAMLLRLGDLLEQHFDELAMLDVVDYGGPITSVRARQRRVLSLVRYYAGAATAIGGDAPENSIPGNVISYTTLEPVGVVAAITAWNGPLPATLTKICPALAAGCTVVLKPSQEASLSSLRLAELVQEAGFPDGVLNVVTGGAEAGAAIAAHPDVDKVTFTGSTATGQSIVRASAGNLKRTTLELGGKSPNIVFADADLERAAAGAAMAVFANSGQNCIAGSRLYVQREIYDEFTERVADIGRSLALGDPLDSSTDLGPLVSSAQHRRVLGYIDQGTREGAVRLSGDEPLGDSLKAGFYVSPTVFAGAREGMGIVTDEIFGPVVAALPFDDEHEVIRRANQTPFGLASGVWTKDIGRAHRVSQSIRAGTVWINSYQLLDPAVPFGGFGMSGYGRESGRRHVEAFMEQKATWINID